ncbi:DUF7537 family lipoprotein [Haloprofundus salilacus]|uniref:DUF7537 family lipoprotein n=1 Tax=Haloprofundus salilacus TaxID=2876190 RepID=UPI001CCBFA63|nr:hypothetical protein [Haloprofundus salilacus]
MPSRIASLAVVSLLLLSGCGGILGDESPTPPSENRTNDSARWLAPGLTSDGVEDAEALASTHRRSVESRSRTAAMRTQVTAAENGSLLSNRSYVVRVADDGRRLAEQTGDSRTDDEYRPRVYWYDPNVSEYAARSGANDGEVSYTYSRETNGELFSDGTYADRLYSLFTVLNVSVAPETVDRSVHRLEASERSLLFDGRELRNVTLTARVDYSGVVRSYELQYETERGGTSVRITERVRITDLGSTEVERPEWVETARNESGGSAAALT